MAFSPEEKQIIEYAKNNGKTAAETKAAIAKFRAGATTQPAQKAASQVQQPQEKPGIFSSAGVIGKAADKVNDFLSLGPIAETYGATIAKARTDDPELREIISQNQPTKREVQASALKGGSTFIPGPAVGAGLGKLALAGAAAGLTYDIGQNIEDGEEGAGILAPGAGAVIGAAAGPVGGPAAGLVGKGAKKGVDAVGRAITDSGKYITQSPVVKGGLQTAVEFGERVPRFVSRQNAEIRDAATRSERIANSPAPIGTALKSGVDERVINTIEQADPATRSGYREIVRLAEETIDKSGTLKTTARPEIVAGEAAANQYKLIDEQRKKVGQAIGEQVQNLSKDRSVSMARSYDELDQTLSEIGVKIARGENGSTLNFGRTGFTKAQRNKINELYDLATEGGEALTPAEIHAKDRLFSQLQRETRMEGIGDILVDTPEGQMSLFRIFRDVYSDTLEEVAPEIRPLNNQYRNLVTFTDDIEKSIIKGGKFETNSTLDPSEFAQTNLRRLFSEAQSAADYRGIADEMDAAARALGYAGGKPEDLAQFAFEVRKIYPDTTPRTGFEGSIRSVGDILMSATKAGTPNTADQQKALRDLIEYYESLPQ